MASTRNWFETVNEAQWRAKKRLPRSVYLALLASTERGLTLSDNVGAFDELAWRPRIGDLPGERDLSTTVLGHEISMPLLISPVGVQAVHPEGEVAVARAAKEEGTAMGLSSFGSKPVEEVAEANPLTFLQTYWVGTRDEILARAERGKAAGAKAFILTLDWSFASRRDWGSPPIPQAIDLKTMVRFAPEVIRKPRYLATYLRHLQLPELGVPNIGAVGEEPPGFFDAYGQWMQTPPPSWDDLAWLVDQLDLPVMIKGVSHPDDARRAVDIGAAALSVSNHGGNNLDGTPGSIRSLPGVVDAVGGQIEILFDGGIRRGADAVKALALGARAVMIGRAYLWGMAANGEQGVRNVLSILRSGIDEALLGLGHASVHDVRREDVIVPAGFTRQDGAPAPAAAAVAALPVPRQSPPQSAPEG
ncbi:mycofactocin system-associated heme/flavin dehydrogenase [Blastococcus sp. TF02-09]|uniref:pre-mycofactocin synthase MftD n=1 Tax=Blastococcus sp. TF02-09 TaxID=2250576 RepID=UPI000DE9F563|nr:pre-mycofactocin synthase MftD [Blastococcus sp. TF02-9]RBY78489.1 mycofactocin system-associated heme/flavin dehydrogenase [Blastococcus sp. TF02-9]